LTDSAQRTDLPPIWVISLERATQRREFVRQRFEAAGIDFELIDGVDGDELAPSDIARYSRRRALFEIARPMTRGDLGCSLSHLYLYERIVHDDIPMAVIMEDDVDPTECLVPVLAELARLPSDWEVLTLHSLFDVSEPSPVSDELIAGEFLVCRYRKTVFGTQCYVIKQAAAKRALAVGQPVCMPPDELLFRARPARLVVYGLEPKVVREGSFGSELVDRPGVVGAEGRSEDRVSLGDRCVVVAGKAWRRLRNQTR
jgi:glycosyl transferase family 25